MGQYKWMEKAIMLSGWILRQNRKGNVPSLRSEMLEGIVNAPKPSHQEQAELIGLAQMLKDDGLVEIPSRSMPGIVRVTS